MSIVNSIRFVDSLREMKKGVEKEYYRNFIHITHTDLDGVSCALVDHLGPERIIRTQYVDTVYTFKMVPELYDVISSAIQKWIHAQKVYKTKIEDLWVLITDFGSIEIEKLNDIAEDSLLYDEHYETNPKNIHFIVIDHHQSKYTKIDTSAFTPAESSVDYFNRFSLGDDPYKLSCGSFEFKPKDDTAVTATTAHQEFRITDDINVSVDMFICNSYCASMLWFILANKIEWTDAIISDAKITTDYFYQVNEYDLGRQGNFIINLDQLEGASKIAYIQAIIDEVSPQMILNCNLNRYIQKMSSGLADGISYRYHIEDVYSRIIDNCIPNADIFGNHNRKLHTHKCFKCGYVTPTKMYDWATDEEKFKCPVCNSTILVDITIDNAIEDYIDHPSVAYHLVDKIIPMICMMNIAYKDFLHDYCEEIIDDTKPHKNYIFMGYDKNGEPATMLVDFPEDKNYRIFYQVHRKKLPEEVNIHTFAKLAMEDMDRRGIHYDMSMIFQPNDDGNMICQLTVNPNNINNVNCYDIAVLNGGGGHPGAAGFPVTRITTAYEVKNN